MADNSTGFSRRNIITGATALGISAIASKKNELGAETINPRKNKLAEASTTESLIIGVVPKISYCFMNFRSENQNYLELLP